VFVFLFLHVGFPYCTIIHNIRYTVTHDAGEDHLVLGKLWSTFTTEESLAITTFHQSANLCGAFSYSHLLLKGVLYSATVHAGSSTNDSIIFLPNSVIGEVRQLL